MELNKFVSYILTEITEGVVSAQQSLSGKGTIVTPSNISTGIPCMSMLDPADSSIRYYVDLVEFKVAIGEVSKNDKGASIGVVFGSVGAKIGASNGTENNSLTEVKFSIPIRYPIQPTSNE